jgi:hypothetical protein
MEIELIILIVLIILIILYLGYKYFSTKDNLKNIKKDEASNEFKSIKNNFDNNKTIKYFGGEYCPFSNINSNAYNIMKDFENEYGDKVTMSYYWSGKDNETMQDLDIKYVPTILNGNNEPIELKLPDNVDTTGLSNDELRTMLLENIYNNL